MTRPQQTVHNGMKVPLFKGKGHPSPISPRDLNLLVKILQAFVNIEVVRGQATHAILSDRKLLLVVGGNPDASSADTPTDNLAVWL